MKIFWSTDDKGAQWFPHRSQGHIYNCTLFLFSFNSNELSLINSLIEQFVLKFNILITDNRFFHPIIPQFALQEKELNCVQTEYLPEQNKWYDIWFLPGFLCVFKFGHLEYGIGPLSFHIEDFFSCPRVNGDLNRILDNTYEQYRHYLHHQVET